jgi:hypothetical protein
MREAGYEWDENKKELNNIEQKPAWSEEDGEMLEEVISNIKYVGKNRKTCSYGLAEKCINWLKSIKGRIGGEK